MTYEEAQKAIESLKAEGYSEEEILIVFHDMFRDGKMTIDELKEMVGLIGYEITEEFLNMSEEEQKEPLYEILGEEDGEEGKEKTEPSDKEPSGKEPSGKEPETKEEPESDEKGSNEKLSESDEEKARKLFGLNK